VRAISFNRFGGPDVLQLADMPEPVAAAGQIAIGVRYAGVNFAFVPGLEVVGTVLAAGTGVDESLVGTTMVAFTGSGGYAEVAVADAALAIPVDTDTTLPLRVAVAAACVLPTAWGVLFGAGRMQDGESVLVHAAAGGVGSIIGQLAREHGAGLVIGVVSTWEKAAYAAQFGCWDGLLLADDFRAEAAAISSGRGFDIICDSVGGSARLAGLDLLAPLGRLVVFGNARARRYRWDRDPPRLAARGRLRQGRRKFRARAALRDAGLAARAVRHPLPGARRYGARSAGEPAHDRQAHAEDLRPERGSSSARVPPAWRPPARSGTRASQH